MRNASKIRWGRPVLTVLAILTACVAAHGQGIHVTGVGPVNRSMGGAGTAAPLDAMGALHWNPASISALPASEVSFGIELLLGDVDLSATVSGTTNTTSGEAGVALIPAIGWVHHFEDLPVTIGLGIYGIGGFRNNLPADPANPLLATAPMYAHADVVQVAPTLSWALSERLSFGVAPTITAAKFTLIPLGPSVINPAPTAGSGNRVHWGGGVQLGLYYITDSCWHYGVSLKSPQFFEDFRFFTPGGVNTFDFDYPMILSVGTAYSGFENWVLAADVRYFDYKNTEGFSELGWSNVFAMAIGAQYHFNDRWYLRAGYNFNANPIQDGDVFTNIATPLIQQHNIAAGSSLRIAKNVDMSLAYVYLVNNDVTGPLPSPPFPAGSTLTNEIEVHSLAFGVTVRY